MVHKSSNDTFLEDWESNFPLTANQNNTLLGQKKNRTRTHNLGVRSIISMFEETDILHILRAPGRNSQQELVKSPHLCRCWVELMQQIETNQD